MTWKSVGPAYLAHIRIHAHGKGGAAVGCMLLTGRLATEQVGGRTLAAAAISSYSPDVNLGLPIARAKAEIFKALEPGTCIEVDSTCLSAALAVKFVSFAILPFR